jgi:hypothetical protein
LTGNLENLGFALVKKGVVRSGTLSCAFKLQTKFYQAVNCISELNRIINSVFWHFECRDFVLPGMEIEEQIRKGFIGQTPVSGINFYEKLPGNGHVLHLIAIFIFQNSREMVILQRKINGFGFG